jgi:hypothetical protein
MTENLWHCVHTPSHLKDTLHAARPGRVTTTSGRAHCVSSSAWVPLAQMPPRHAQWAPTASFFLNSMSSLGFSAAGQACPLRLNVPTLKQSNSCQNKLLLTHSMNRTLTWPGHDKLAEPHSANRLLLELQAAVKTATAVMTTTD